MDDESGLFSEPSNEATGMPQWDLTSAWYNLQWPPEITHTISTITPTASIYGQLYIAGGTEAPGPADGIVAQVGFGPLGSEPGGESWSWSDMSFNAQAGNNDEYVGTLLPDQVGEFVYATRYSADNGETWFYADLGGPGYNEEEAGQLHVVPSDDTTAPAAPQALIVTGATVSSISLAWEANGEPDLAGYEIYRSLVNRGNFELIARVPADSTSYTDLDVATGATYEYYLVAYDTSWNRSDASNFVQATAEARMVALTIDVTVPAWTPGTVYIVGNNPAIGNWDPGAIPLTQVDADTWRFTTDILDGTMLEYKFTRGDWERVEKEADGNTEVPNRQLTVSYGSGGTQLVEVSIANWRDPVVVAHVPGEDATEVPINSTISVTWSQAMADDTDFTVTGPSGPVAGTFAYDAASYTVTFTPDEPLAEGTDYAVTVVGQIDVAGDVQQAPEEWVFTTKGTASAIQLANLGSTSGGFAWPLALLGATLALGLGLALQRRRNA